MTLEGDPTCIQYAAKALMQLQMVVGTIPRIYGKGANADRLFRLMMRMKQVGLNLLKCYINKKV